MNRRGLSMHLRSCSTDGRTAVGTGPCLTIKPNQGVFYGPFGPGAPDSSTHVRQGGRKVRLTGSVRQTLVPGAASHAVKRQCCDSKGTKTKAQTHAVDPFTGACFAV